MVFGVELSVRAESDIDGVLVEMIAHAPQTAQRWYERLITAINTLESMPQRCPLAEEAPELGIELRELTFGKRRGTFRILFVVDGSTVRVLHIRRALRGDIGADDI